MEHDAMLIVRAGMIRRIDAIAARATQMSLAMMCDEIDQLRHEARRYGMEPVEKLASLLESAMAMNGLGAVILSYLDLMRDAVACEDTGPDASTTYLAAMSLRLGR